MIGTKLALKMTKRKQKKKGKEYEYLKMTKKYFLLFILVS